MDRERDRTLTQHDTHRFPERLVVEVVLNRRRRYVLYYVHERSGSVALETVAAQVAAWERGAQPDEVPADHRESVLASLRRTHLPYLHERELVTFDPAHDLVVGQVTDPDVELFLANDPRTRVAWYGVYLVLTAVSTVLLALVEFGVPPFDDLRPITVAGIIVTLFALASFGYWYDVYRWRRRTEDAPPNFLVTIEEDVSYQDEDESSEDDQVQ